MIKCEDVYLTADIINNEKSPLHALSLLLDEGINEELYSILVTDEASLNIDYLLNRQNRYMSPLWERLYKALNNDINDTNDEIAHIIKMKFLYNWNKLAEAVFSEYNPIDNYNMVENRSTDLEEHTVTENSETVENKYAGFNSDEMKKVSESSTNGDIDSTKTDSGSKATNELTRRGNIGVTTTAQMIEGEYKLRKKNIIDMIYKDIDSILFIDYYS